MANKIRNGIKAVFCAAVLWLALTVAVLLCCDKVMIFSYRGLDTMFSYPKTEFQAAVGGLNLRVPGFAVRLMYPEEDNNSYSLYRDDKTPRYFVQLIYNDKKPKHNTVEHSHNSCYTIEYTKEGSHEHSDDIADEHLQDVMLGITEDLYDLDHEYDPSTDDYSAFTGSSSDGRPNSDSKVTVISFMLYCHDNGYFVEQQNKAVYNYYDGGSLDKIMNEPRNKYFDYCIWKR